MVKGGCSNFTPAIIDTDGALRWVGTAGFGSISATFFDNAVYLAHGPRLYRIDLDGDCHPGWRLQQSRSYVNFHHNIDRGKVGIILDADTTSFEGP